MSGTEDDSVHSADAVFPNETAIAFLPSFESLRMA